MHLLRRVRPDEACGMRSAWRPWAPIGIPAAAFVAVGVAASAGTLTEPLTLAGLLASGMVAVAAALHRRSPLVAGQVIPLATALSLLAVCGAGLDQASPTQSWRSIVAIAAYPFLGHTVRRVVAAHRTIREADAVVEAVLVGTAVGIVLHVALSGHRAQTFSTVWGDAEGAFPALLVALDVAVLVMSLRAVRGGSPQRPLELGLTLGLVALLGAHLLQALAIAFGEPAGPPAVMLAMLALIVLGGVTLHPAAHLAPSRLLEDPPLFSPSHAVVVSVALLAAPGVVAVQAWRGVIASATVATGTMVTGLVLASYLLGLLRERAETEHQATHDGLTGLPNRVLLVDRLERAIAHARRVGTSSALLFIDLDRFKDINDTYGHDAGDRVLTAVSARLQRSVRDEDTVARLSGDEFVILLPHLPSPDHVTIVAQRVLESLGQPLSLGEDQLLLSGSIGIASYPSDGASASELLASADAAMYRAKEATGNRWEAFTPELATDAQARLHVEAALLSGIPRGELVLHYQPIADLRTGRLEGAEALVRWNHPERGLLQPVDFIPVAEQTDLIVLLGEWVIQAACCELRRWEELGFGDRSISVNVASRQLDHGLVSVVAAALRASGANPANLIIELTEGTILDHLDGVAAALDELSAMGVRSAIDDFGTGYCGLRYLSVLPVDTLKIDRSFIQGMTPSSAAIVAGTIAMGHALGLTMTAEGVETSEQRQFLLEQGCERMQGFLLGRPMPASEMVARLRADLPPNLISPAQLPVNTLLLSPVPERDAERALEAAGVTGRAV